MRAAVGLLLLANTFASCSSQSVPAEERWREIKQEIRTRFAGVDHVTTDELRAELDGSGDLLLVDVRPAAEFEVSHLRGARNAPGGEGLDVPKDRPIVVYCSVGYRSAQAAQRLKASGFRNVRNYLGSIFEWANRGLPIENRAGAADKVHPYDESWGELLRPELRGAPR